MLASVGQIWGSALGTVRHPEISAEFLNGRHPGGDGHFFGDGGEGVMQAPGVSWTKLIHKWLEVEIRCLRQEADRQNPLDKNVMNDPFSVLIRETAVFQVRDFTGKPSEVILEPEDRMVDLGSQVESGGVLAIEGNEIAPKHHVVADENGQSRADLDRHRLVVRRA